jgi:hypothetical protein
MDKFLPEIVYFQTLTKCNGHCYYCPFDDIYYGNELPYTSMKRKVYQKIIEWLVLQQYEGRLGFLLHYEPTLDDRLTEWIKWTREKLKKSKIEIATNGIIKTDLLDCVDEIIKIPAGAKDVCTSRAGNVKACDKTIKRKRFSETPCSLPKDTMCIAATGELLLCCQDWRHEIIVGTYKDITSARNFQLSVNTNTCELCLDCIAGKTAEEVGERLGKRNI